MAVHRDTIAFHSRLKTTAVSCENNKKARRLEKLQVIDYLFLAGKLVRRNNVRETPLMSLRVER